MQDVARDMTQEDYVELQRELLRRGIVGTHAWPIKVGECMMVRTVTHYAVGRIAEIGPDFFWLKEASSIPHEGRRHHTLEEGLVCKEGERGLLPEIEPVPEGGYLGVMRAAIVDFVPWPHALPKTHL